MANNFSDPSCKALWLFTPGALTADSKGGNTLIDTGSIVAGTPIQGVDTVFLGGYSQYYSVPDANLDAGFPFKDGDTQRLITVVLKVRPAGSNEFNLIGKTDFWSPGNFGLSFDPWYFFGYNGGYHNTTGDSGWGAFLLQAGHEYQIAYKIDGINGLITAYIYDYAGSTWGIATWAPGAPLDASTLPFLIGHGNGRWGTGNGDVGEAAVFDRLLSDAEIDAIRAGTYTPPTTTTTTSTTSTTTITSPGDLVVSSIFSEVSYHLEPDIYAGSVFAQVSYNIEPNLYVGSLFVQVAYSETAAARRKFPVPNNRTRWQTQMGCRIFPIVS